MNRNYKVVWNQSLGCFTAVAEYAKSRGKSSSSSVTSNASINIEATSSKGQWRLSALAAGLASLALGLSPSVMAEVGVSGGTGGGTAISNCDDSRQANSGSNTENIVIGCSSSTDHTGLFIADRGNPYYTDNATNAALVDAADRNAYTPRGEEGGSVAIGTGAKTEIALGLAIGEYAKTTKIAGIALGVGSLSTGNTALALGRQSTATADYAQAIGNVAAATGKGSLAVGHSATATGYRAIAIGATDIDQATASFGQSGANYQAVGQTKATADDTIAFGSGSQATATNALAFGSFSKANKTGSVALGNGSRTNENTTSETTLQVGQTTYAVAGSVLDTGGNLKEGAQVSVGSRGSERQIKNVAGGRIAGDSTDAVNGSQLYAVNTELNKGFNISAQGGADDNVQLGETVDFTNTDGNLVVTNTDNKINYNLAENIAVTQLTTGNTVVNNDGITLTGGTNQTIRLTNNGLNNGGNTIANVAAGVNPTDAANVSQLGSAAAASRTEVVGGTNVNVTNATGANNQTISTVNADGTTVSSANPNALTVTAGTKDANNVTDYAIDLGQDTKNSLVKADNSVQYDNADQTSVTLGGTGATAPVTLTNVANGDLSATSTDAVNGSQLNATNTNVTNNTTAVNNVQEQANLGFNISAQGGANDNVQLGETVDFTNTDGNLVVTNTDNKINYDLAENIAVTQLTTGNTVVNNDGVTLTGGTNQTVILSNNGLNNGGNIITNVAAGVNDTDAANVSQINNAAAASKTEVTAGTNVASVTQSTGANGQAIYTVNANGTTASAGSEAVTVTNSTPDANNVTDYQFDLSNDTKNSLVKADNSVQYDNADQTSVTLGGTGATAPVTLTNVANGDLSATSTDAVNGSQLNATNENVGANTNNITTNANNIAGNTTNITNAQTQINQGFNLTADNGDEDNVQLGEAVNFTNTDGNLIATVSDNGINYDLADVINVGTDNPIAINGTAGTISGLTNTTFDGDTVYTGGQAATQEQLSAVNAATNNNLNQGLNFTGDNTTVVVNRKFGQTLTIKGGATDLTENNIGVVADANGDLNVQLAKDLTGLNSATFGDVVISTSGLNNGGNKITNVADGSVTAGSKDAVNGGQLNQAIETVNTSITQAKTTVTEGDNIVVTQSTNADGSTDYKVETARDLEVDSVKAGDSTLDDNGLTIAGGPSVTKDGINAAGNKITNVADGTEASDAVNFGQLQNSVADANKGFNISAQGGNTTTVGNGGAVDFNSKNNNIIVSKSAENNDVSFELNKDLNVNTVTATSVTTGNTTTNNGGVTITGGPNQTVALTNQGLNNGGNRVTGVATGIDATDAVNVGQLNGFGTTINSSINDLGYRIDDVEDDANAGVSAAMAMSSIPQSFLPGKSMVGGGIATYNGESAVAIGVSRVSDNGRWVLKVNGTADTQGNAGGAVGAGFHF